MQLRGIHHVTVIVDDLEAALPFYVDVLGLAPLPRPDLGVPGAWLDATGGDQVHLLELKDQPRCAAQHFAFEVGDLDAVVADLGARGVTARVGRRLAGAGYQATVHDPSGNLIEFNQPAGAAR